MELFFAGTTIQSESVVVLYSVIWLLILFKADPIPMYSMTFILILGVNILWQKKAEEKIIEKVK